MLSVTRAALERLLHKHHELARLRDAHAAGEPVPEKAFFVAFAGEFPGALRELDRLPSRVLASRTRELERTLAEKPEREVFVDLEPWLEVSLAYHATLGSTGTWAPSYASPLLVSRTGRHRVATAIASIAAHRGLTTIEVRALLFPHA